MSEPLDGLLLDVTDLPWAELVTDNALGLALRAGPEPPQPASVFANYASEGPDA